MSDDSGLPLWELHERGECPDDCWLCDEEDLYEEDYWDDEDDDWDDDDWMDDE